MMIIFKMLAIHLSLYVVLHRGINASRRGHVRKEFSYRNAKDMPEWLGTLNITSESWAKRHESVNNIFDNFLKKIEAIFPKSTRLRTIGNSTSDHWHVYALEIQPKVHKGTTIVIDAGMHGNHWESVNMAMYIIYHLLRDDLKLAYWMKIAIITMVNPDGYVKAIDNTKFGTNVRPTYVGNDLCDGVDISRNFEVGLKPEFDGCSTYQGTEYGSEKETQNIMRYFAELGDVKLYLSMHAGPEPACGYPYAYRSYKPHESSRKMALKIKEVINEKLNNAGFSGLLMQARNLEGIFHHTFGGAAVDWAADVRNVPYSIYFIIERWMEWDTSGQVKITMNANTVATMFEAYYRGIKRAIFEVQVTDVNVGQAFLQECGIKTKARSTANLSEFNFKISFYLFIYCLYGTFSSFLYSIYII